MFSLFADKPERTMNWLIMWASWNAKNDITFNRKDSNPLQVIQYAKAMLSAQQIEDRSNTTAQHSPPQSQNFISPKFDRERYAKGSNLFTDVAWKEANTTSSTLVGPMKKAELGLRKYIGGHGSTCTWVNSKI